MSAQGWMSSPRQYPPVPGNAPRYCGIGVGHLKDQDLYTLPIWLASFSNPVTGTDFGGQMAASVVFSLPVVIFILLLIQRHLVAGMSAGAVNG